MKIILTKTRRLKRCELIFKCNKKKVFNKYSKQTSDKSLKGRELIYTSSVSRVSPPSFSMVPR